MSCDLLPAGCASAGSWSWEWSGEALDTRDTESLFYSIIIARLQPMGLASEEVVDCGRHAEDIGKLTAVGCRLG